MFKQFTPIIIAICVFLLTACGAGDKNVLKVGTISGPETELMEVAKNVAQEKYGLTIKIVEFTDYIQPNAALNDGSLDANMFQHQPYLDQQIKDRHYNLIALGKTFVYPMGIYSARLKQLNDLPANAVIAIPNDPSNEGRALLLLQKANLIQLNPKAGLFATPADIESNPKHLVFKELDAAEIARSLPDVAAAVINTNYAIPAGLSPTKDALFHEGPDSPYANIIVIRKDEQNDPRMKPFLAAFQSEEVLKAAKKIFNDQAIPAW
ncbi:MAG: D-methionine ABC transporter, periplasmic D-methionine-binding protein [uncultured bacterium]|nr:MAG: D-methionine ABC transporter, periplasmic D-methionine-binding protein [uncultured bacterium]